MIYPSDVLINTIDAASSQAAFSFLCVILLVLP
jgi:hypothetical protein